jgi:ABC-type glycerol-3-phosphate transport system substrate-binding protein
MRRLTLLLVLALALAACGGSSHPKTKTSSGPSAQQQIKSAYVKFFSSKTDVAGKVKLLQNGEQFKPVIKVFASNPLASDVSATVSSVTLQGADKAKVVYAVKFGGSSLPEQTGTAVRENGTWKVGNASLCKLIALSGTTPSACKS